MARIDVLPSIEIIRGLKGILDFYLWRGLPCVRAWPKYRPANQTAASLAAALVFGAIVKAYSLVGETAISAYRELAVGIPRTARDLMVTGVYGNLHEASMSDFLELLTDARDFLSDLTALLGALHDVGADEFDVHVHATVLPPNASTFTAQGNQNVNLALIAQLQDALESKALDRLLIRGMDQIHSYAGPLASAITDDISGAEGYLLSATPPAGQVWIVTNITAADSTSATTEHNYTLRRAAVSYFQGYVTAAFAAARYSRHQCLLWLEPGDKMRVTFTGGLLADLCTIRMIGHIMTLET